MDIEPTSHVPRPASSLDRPVQFGYAPRPRSSLYVHLVFVTKYREDRLLARRVELERSFYETCARYGCRIVQSNGEDNHWHLIIQLNPRVSIAQLVNCLKAASSYATNKTSRGSKFAWSRGYYASSVSKKTLGTTVPYVRDQGRAKH